MADKLVLYGLQKFNLPLCCYN